MLRSGGWRGGSVVRWVVEELCRILDMHLRIEITELKGMKSAD